MDLLLPVLAILVSSLVLIKSADWAITSILKISRTTKTRTFSIAAVLLALTTSFPELLVGVNSAILGVPALSLGNVIGANIADISLVLGLAGVLGGVLHFKHLRAFSTEIGVAFFAGVFPFLLILDKTLSRLDGALLILAYIGYVTGFLNKTVARLEKTREPGVQQNFLGNFFRGLADNNGDTRREMIKFLGAVFLLVISSRLLVQFAVNFAGTAGIPLFLVGLLAVSIGTTLPELALVYRSVRRDQDDPVVGSSLGSMATNALLILGLVAVISPISVPARQEYLLSVITLVFSLALFWFFARTKKRLDRWEAAVLFSVYIVFVLLEIFVSGI